MFDSRHYVLILGFILFVFAKILIDNVAYRRRRIIIGWLLKQSQVIDNSRSVLREGALNVAPRLSLQLEGLGAASIKLVTNGLLGQSKAETDGLLLELRSESLYTLPTALIRVGAFLTPAWTEKSVDLASNDRWRSIRVKCGRNSRTLEFLRDAVLAKILGEFLVGRGLRWAIKSEPGRLQLEVRTPEATQEWVDVHLSWMLRLATRWSELATGKAQPDPRKIVRKPIMAPRRRTPAQPRPAS